MPIKDPAAFRKYNHSPKARAARARYQKNASKRYKLQWHIKHRYGMSLSDYDNMLSSQNGGCAACGHKPTGDERLCVDHDHETGRVRGLLCKKCNQSIGLAMDNPYILMRLAGYLMEL